MLVCCGADDDGETWDWTVETVALGVIVGEAPYRNSLDPETRLDVLRDDLMHDAAMVDGNAVLLAVACLTPLLMPRDEVQGSRNSTPAMTYATFLDAARPDSYVMPRPVALAPQLYALCADVNAAITGTQTLITPPWVHAKALAAALRQYAANHLDADYAAMRGARHRVLAALHDYLVAPKAPDRADHVPDPKYFDGPPSAVAKRTVADAVSRALATRRYTTPQRLAELRLLATE